MDEITCPYCEYSYDLCHDDGAFYNEDNLEKEECPECGKTYMVQSSISWNFEGFKADCLNGGEHEWEQMHGAPREHFIGMFECKNCNEQESRDPEGRKKAMQDYLKKL